MGAGCSLLLGMLALAVAVKLAAVRIGRTRTACRWRPVLIWAGICSAVLSPNVTEVRAPSTFFVQRAPPPSERARLFARAASFARGLRDCPGRLSARAAASHAPLAETLVPSAGSWATSHTPTSSRTCQGSCWAPWA